MALSNASLPRLAKLSFRKRWAVVIRRYLPRRNRHLGLTVVLVRALQQFEGPDPDGERHEYDDRVVLKHQQSCAEEQQGKAGDQPGDHILEVEWTLEELVELMGEELCLPRIQPKAKNQVEGDVTRYTGIRRVGPEGLRHFKRTYREALKRQLISGTYDPQRPAVLPIREDKRYRSWKGYPRPDSKAAVIYMMDVSGSMTQRKKELVRLTAFWIDAWLRAHYKNLVTRYIVHDAAAHEVDVDTFYHIRENGGTCISSAYEMCRAMIHADYPVDDWNTYAFHFSDGENFDEMDDLRCVSMLEKNLLPQLNLFCYGEVQSGVGAQFMESLTRVEDDKLVRAKIDGDDDIYSAIKAFLGKGA